MIRQHADDLIEEFNNRRLTMRTQLFTFASTTAGLVQREALAASLLSLGRTVRLFREECAGFELLGLEAGPRATEGQIAAAMKGQR
jgi:hypothetical protein